MHAAMDRFADTYPDWLEYVEKDVDGELHKDWYFTSPNGDKLFIQELTYSSKPGHNYRVTGYGALEWKEFDTFDEALAYAEKLHNGEETMKMASRKACDCKKGPHGEKGPHGPMHGEPHPENPMHISQDNDSFDTAIELDDLAQSAEDDLGKDESEVKKAEWIATRIAERKLKAKLNDEVMHHLASMGSKTAMLAVGKILDRKAFDSYKKEAKTFKPSKALRLNREARLKRWANRKIAYGDDWEIFIGAVEDPTNGEWVTLPTSDSDIDAAIERAQEGPDGEFYEEVMIADTTFGAGADIEYMDPHEVNEYISDFENSGYDKDFIQTLIDDLGFEQAANEIDDVEYYEDVNDEQDLGYAVVEALGGVENLDPDTLQSHFNYESFGRDLTFEGYNIDNGFAYRVAMHNRLARKIDTMRVIALIEKNLK